MRIIEEKASFSSSRIWDLQKRAYLSFGAKAWSEKGVPFYLTSNALTASLFAKLIKTLKPPYTVIDLGTGVGRFAYLLLKRLCPKRYICTDICEENLQFLRSHPYLRTWFQQGVLQTALFHHEDEIAPFLSSEGTNVVIANYFFDTIPQELYRKKNNKVEKGFVTLKLPEQIDEKDPACIEYLELTYSYQMCQEPFISYEDTSFLLPTGAFSIVDQLAKKNCVLLAGDQGVCTEAQIKAYGEPKLSRHGTFSIAVNEHALARYIEQKGGIAYLPRDPDYSFVILAATFNKASLPYETIVDPFTPAQLNREIDRLRLKTPTVEEIFLLLEKSCYDPIAFLEFIRQIESKIWHLSDAQKARLHQIIAQIKENFFPITDDDTFFLTALAALSCKLSVSQS